LDNLFIISIGDITYLYFWSVAYEFVEHLYLININFVMKGK